MDRYARPEFEAAARAVKDRTHQQPRIGIVLGSGLGAFAASVENADVIPYHEIPHWPVSKVVGHSGTLYVGQMEGQPVMVMSGRAHYYEGFPMSQITLPIRVMQLMGVEIVVLTNAAGAINRSIEAGSLMFITDHLNLPGIAGHNPLRGTNDDEMGTRFPDMGQAYDPDLRALARSVAEDKAIPCHEGIYAMVGGPSFETPAEIRFLQAAGADAVGMSTVPETIVARHGDMRVLGISGITNVTTMEPTTKTETTHQEVLETGKILAPRLVTIVRGVLRQLPASN
jgi:purine-nucleoside phosphorylase